MSETVPLEALLRELEIRGEEHDARTREHSQRYLNITRDTGQCLAVLLKATRAGRVLEIGTSHGYSTLWLAASLGEGGSLVTLESSADKARHARANFARAGLDDRILLVEAHAGDYLRDPASRFDFIFLDADRREYLDFAEPLIEALVPGGVLVCDNAVSHRAELVDFMRRIEEDPRFTTCLVPVGKGEFVACRERGHGPGHVPFDGKSTE